MAHSRVSVRKQAVHQKTDFPLRDKQREESMGNSIVDSMKSSHKYNTAVARTRIWSCEREIEVMLSEMAAGGLWIFHLWSSGPGSPLTTLTLQLGWAVGFLLQLDVYTVATPFLPDNYIRDNMAVSFSLLLGIFVPPATLVLCLLGLFCNDPETIQPPVHLHDRTALYSCCIDFMTLQWRQIGFCSNLMLLKSFIVSVNWTMSRQKGYEDKWPVVSQHHISALLSLTNQQVIKLELGVPINDSKKIQLQDQLPSGVSRDAMKGTKTSSYRFRSVCPLYTVSF